jgi:hypothetical protein
MPTRYGQIPIKSRQSSPKQKLRRSRIHGLINLLSVRQFTAVLADNKNRKPTVICTHIPIQGSLARNTAYVDKINGNQEAGTDHENVSSGLQKAENVPTRWAATGSLSQGCTKQLRSVEITGVIGVSVRTAVYFILISQ